MQINVSSFQKKALKGRCPEHVSEHVLMLSMRAANGQLIYYKLVNEEPNEMNEG